MSSLIRRMQKRAKGTSPGAYHSEGCKLGVHWDHHPRQKKPRGRRRGKMTAKYLARLQQETLARLKDENKGDE